MKLNAIIIIRFFGEMDYFIKDKSFEQKSSLSQLFLIWVNICLKKNALLTNMLFEIYIYYFMISSALSLYYYFYIKVYFYIKICLIRVRIAD